MLAICITACQGHVSKETPTTGAAPTIAAGDGDWEIRFRRSYPPGNPPPKDPPLNPITANITLSATITGGHIMALHTTTKDPSGTIWADSVVRRGTTVLTTRHWLACQTEHQHFAGDSLKDLIEQVVGPVAVPADARMKDGTYEWRRAEGVEEVQVTQSGQDWTDRRLGYYRAETGKQLYTIDDIEFGQAQPSTQQQTDFADHAYRHACAR
jgi:hypothetical protein